jgi:hypothetical protein
MVRDGRHPFVSHALAGGRTLAEVRDAAGHVSVATCGMCAVLPAGLAWCRRSLRLRWSMLKRFFAKRMAEPVLGPMDAWRFIAATGAMLVPESVSEQARFAVLCPS